MEDRIDGTAAALTPVIELSRAGAVVGAAATKGIVHMGTGTHAGRPEDKQNVLHFAVDIAHLG